MRTSVSEADTKGRDKKLHLSDAVGCNYLSLSLIPASDKSSCVEQTLLQDYNGQGCNRRRLASLVPVKAQVEDQVGDMYSLRMLPFFTRKQLIKIPRIKSGEPFANTV